MGKRMFWQPIILWTVLLAGCGSERFESGQEVWISPEGLGAHLGSWIITEPWGVGRVLETKDRMVQIQIERGDSAGIEGLKGEFQPGRLHWFPEDQLQAIEKGKAAYDKRAPARHLLTGVLRNFAASGNLNASAKDIERAMKVARGDGILALRVLMVATNQDLAEVERIREIRKLIAGDTLARQIAGQTLADWIVNTGFDNRVSSVLDFRKDRRSLVVRPRLSKSVPGTLAGIAAISVYEKLNRPSGADALPELERMAEWEMLDRELLEIVLEAVPDTGSEERKRRLESMALEWKEARRRRLAVPLKITLGKNLVLELAREKDFRGLEDYQEKIGEVRQRMETEGRYWPLSERDLEDLDRMAGQQIVVLRKQEAERKAREERDRRIRERDARLIAELTAVTEKAVKALKQEDFVTACKIGAAIPRRYSGFQQMLVIPNIENVFMPQYIRLSRYEEYKKPIHGADRLAELEFKAPSGRTGKVQFRELKGHWKIYSGWWDNRNGKYLAKGCDDWLKGEK